MGRRRRNLTARAQVNREVRGRAGKCSRCSKRSYPTETDAILAVGTGGGRGGVRAYQCPIGNGWHVTSQRSGAATHVRTVVACAHVDCAGTATKVIVHDPGHLMEVLRIEVCDAHHAMWTEAPASLVVTGEGEIRGGPGATGPYVPGTVKVRAAVNVDTARLERRLRVLRHELAGGHPASDDPTWRAARRAELDDIVGELRRRGRRVDG